MCWLVLVCWLGVEQARTWSHFTEWCLGDTEVERKYRLFFQEIPLWNTWYLSYGIQHAVLNICLHLTSKPVGQSWYPSVSLFSEAQTQNLACNQHIIKICSILLNNSITNPLFPVSLFLWFHCGYGQRVTLFETPLPNLCDPTLSWLSFHCPQYFCHAFLHQPWSVHIPRLGSQVSLLFPLNFLAPELWLLKFPLYGDSRTSLSPRHCSCPLSLSHAKLPNCLQDKQESHYEGHICAGWDETFFSSAVGTGTKFEA